MARTKGAVNTSTMIKAIRDAGRYEAGLEDAPRERIKAIYEAVQRNAGVVPQPKGSAAPTPTHNPPPAPTPAPAVAQKATVVEPTPREVWQKKHEARLAAIREKQAAVAATFVKRDPPFPRDSVVDTTLVEGRTVEEWDAVIEARFAVAAANRVNGLGIVNLCDLPGWVCWAVEQWKRLGKPTVKGKALDEINDLLDKAKENEKYASLDDEEARKADNERAPKIAKKKREQAEKKRTKASEQREQANEIAKLHSIKLTAA